jgi:hypothetical protein
MPGWRQALDAIKALCSAMLEPIKEWRQAATDSRVVETIHARYSESREWIRERLKEWRQAAIDDPLIGEIRRVLAICILLIGVTFVGFLWITGIIDWRGSDGRTDLVVDFICSGKVGTADLDACAKGIRASTTIETYLDFQRRNNEGETLDFRIGVEKTSPVYRLYNDLAPGTQLQLMSDRRFDLPPPSQSSW